MSAALAIAAALGSVVLGAPWWAALVTYLAALGAFAHHDTRAEIDSIREREIVVQIETEGHEPERYVPLWVAPPSDS